MAQKSGQLSCCAKGGAWFKKCGANADHSWVDGIKACKRKTVEENRDMTCKQCGTYAKSGRSSCCAPGGSWSDKCGRDAQYSWGEGFQACKSECARCATIKKNGKSSCCAPGGAWANTCGSGKDKDALHTWAEGIRACLDAVRLISRMNATSEDTVNAAGDYGDYYDYDDYGEYGEYTGDDRQVSNKAKDCSTCGTLSQIVVIGVMSVLILCMRI